MSQHSCGLGLHCHTGKATFGPEPTKNNRAFIKMCKKIQ